MASFTNIDSAKRASMGVSGLPDTPEMSVSELQSRFDSLANYALDTLYSLISILNSNNASIYLKYTDGNTFANKMSAFASDIKRLNDALNEFGTRVQEVEELYDGIDHRVQDLYDTAITQSQFNGTLNADITFKKVLSDISNSLKVDDIVQNSESLTILGSNIKSEQWDTVKVIDFAEGIHTFNVIASSNTVAGSYDYIGLRVLDEDGKVIAQHIQLGSSISIPGDFTCSLSWSFNADNLVNHTLQYVASNLDDITVTINKSSLVY